FLEAGKIFFENFRFHGSLWLRFKLKEKRRYPDGFDHYKLNRCPCQPAFWCDAQTTNEEKFETLDELSNPSVAGLGNYPRSAADGDRGAMVRQAHPGMNPKFVMPVQTGIHNPVRHTGEGRHP
ncbi:MAG TPA: hypothetical protein PK424_07425, partial [Smithella sp.]|nr:hypothetical protein [Smithella sp.]